MSIGRALAEYIAEQRLNERLPDDPTNEPDIDPKLPPLILPGKLNAIYPDVVNFVDQEQERSRDFDPMARREGMAYGIVSDVLAPRYGGEARIASVVFDFANRLDYDRGEDKQGQEFRFERAFSAILNILSVLPDDMRELTAYPPYIDPENDMEKHRFNYKISSLQVTDSARILISAGFMRGYIVVDVGYTQE